MSLHKNPKFDLKLSYKRTLEISFVISLFLLIVAFKYMPDYSKKVIPLDEGEQDIIIMEDIPQTEHIKPPPPPMPELVIELPVDEDPDIEFAETELNPEANVTKTILQPPKEDVDEEEPPAIFKAVQNPPKPLLGLSDILNRLEYPEIAKKVGIQGTVLISAIIDEEGFVESAQVYKGIGGGCDEEALKVVLETKFSPGKQRGKAVKVNLIIPIKFRLQN